MERIAVAESDVEELGVLKPEDWEDIRPGLRFYLSSPGCSVWKYLVEGRIAGLGASIRHKNTAWLGHIIVHPDFRGKGLGTAITRSLIADLSDTDTICLIATPAGKRVYDKLGFETEGDYVFYKGGEAPQAMQEGIIQLETAYHSQVLGMDRALSGEDRSALLRLHLDAGMICMKEDKVSGFYLPSLGEGLIMASDEHSGLKLLEKKLTTMQRAVVMEENRVAIEFLTRYGYSEVKRGTRMHLGKPVSYSPACLYNRISGGLG